MRTNTIFTAILLAVAVMFVLLSFQYRYEARIAPLLVGSLAVLCLAIVLVKDIRAMYRARQAEVQAAGGSPGIGAQLGAKGYLVPVAWVVGLVVGIYLAGLVIALPIFVLVYMRVYKESWLASLVASACVFLVIWGFFYQMLHTTLYWGILLE